MISKPYKIPYLVQVMPPATEPLTLAETKLFLRADGTAEDSIITRLITVARQNAEQFMRNSLITQSWKLSFDEAAPSKILLPRGPVQSITSIKIRNRDATETIIASSVYYLNAGKEILVMDSAQLGHAIEITYATGFGDATAVPGDIKQGMLNHIAELYDNRPSFMAIPESSMALYSAYRIVSL